MSAAAENNETTPRLIWSTDPVGMLTLGRTTYTVHAITNAGPFAQLKSGKPLAVVLGKRGAVYLLMDNGPKFQANVWNISETTKGWGGNLPSGNPWSRLGGFRQRDEVMKMLGREGQ